MSLPDSVPFLVPKFNLMNGFGAITHYFIGNLTVKQLQCWGPKMAEFVRNAGALDGVLGCFAP